MALSASLHSLNWDFTLNWDFLKWNFTLVTRFHSLNRDFALNRDSLNRYFTVVSLMNVFIVCLFTVFTATDVNAFIRDNVERTSAGHAVCRICGSLIRQWANVRRHVLDQHVDAGTVYMCPACKRPYKNKSSFSQHIYMEHKDWKGIKFSNFKVRKF